MYAVHKQFDAHEPARRWLDEQLNGTSRVAMPWPSLVAFARLSCNPSVVTRPVRPSRAMDVVRTWLGVPAVWVPSPTNRHAELMEGLLRPETKPDLVPDAHLAALAIEHGLELCSTDRDFARFEGLRWRDPLR